jgi:hypothetical protein
LSHDRMVHHPRPWWTCCTPRCCEIPHSVHCLRKAEMTQHWSGFEKCAGRGNSALKFQTGIPQPRPINCRRLVHRYHEESDSSCHWTISRIGEILSTRSNEERYPACGLLSYTTANFQAMTCNCSLLFAVARKMTFLDAIVTIDFGQSRSINLVKWIIAPRKGISRVTANRGERGGSPGRERLQGHRKEVLSNESTITYR